MASAICCAKCCTVFSMAGIVFLIIIGILLKKQPIYVHGIQDPLKSSQGCFEGAAIYGVTLVVSIAYWMYDEGKKRVTGGSNGNIQETNKFGNTYGAVSPM